MHLDNILEKVNDYDALTQKEKVKLIAYFYCITANVNTFTSSQIENFFSDNNLDAPANMSRELISLTIGRPPALIKKKIGYSFQRNVKNQLDGLFNDEKHFKETSIVLRSLIGQVGSTEQKAFLEEAIACFEIKSYRACIIMTWLLSMDTLLEYTLKEKLVEFNAELMKKGKKKLISSKSDFEEHKESEIIETFKAAGIISKEQKKLLDEKLSTRNSAAHPNTTHFREPKVITFIQELVEDIIGRYSNRKQAA